MNKGATLQEKMEYVKQVDDYVSGRGVTISDALAALGKASSFYYKYKNDIKRTGFGAGLASSFEKFEKREEQRGEVSSNVFLSIELTDMAFKRLKVRADNYAIKPEYVASILLHDAISKMGDRKIS